MTYFTILFAIFFKISIPVFTLNPTKVGMGGKGWMLYSTCGPETMFWREYIVDEVVGTSNLFGKRFLEGKFNRCAF